MPRGTLRRRVPQLFLGAVLLAGCATTDVSSRAPERSVDERPSSTLTRCSPADPDRGAWFCVIGQALYSIGANFVPDTPHRFR